MTTRATGRAAEHHIDALAFVKACINRQADRFAHNATSYTPGSSKPVSDACVAHNFVTRRAKSAIGSGWLHRGRRHAGYGLVIVPVHAATSPGWLNLLVNVKNVSTAGAWRRKWRT